MAAAVAAEVRGGGESDAPAHILADDTEQVGTVGEAGGGTEGIYVMVALMWLLNWLG